MTINNPRIVIMGPPGSGKSTQAEVLAKHFDLPYISTGDLLRHIASTNTPLGQKIREYQDRGAIVPDDITLQLVYEVVDKKEYQRGYVGEGFPRTISQAIKMNELIDLVVLIDVSDEVVVNRLLSRLVCPKCGQSYNSLTEQPKNSGICDVCLTGLVNRSDDNRQTITKRLAVYHQLTEPVIDYFTKQNKLIAVDGAPPIEIVSKTIVTAVTSYLKGQ